MQIKGLFFVVNLRDKNNDNWTFFSDRDANLCFRINDGESEVLQEKCSEEFDACFDESGNIHIAFQMENGELGYIFYDFQNWKRICVLKSKHNKKAFSNLRIFCINQRPELFYCMSYNYKYYIVHHRIMSSLTNPIALDYCCENSFSICCDNEANVHIIYKSESDEFIHKTFNSSSQSYYDTKINTNENAKKIVCMYDSQNRLNLLCVSRTKTHYTLSYENPSLNIKKTLGFGTDSLCLPYIHTDGNRIIITWHERFFAYRTFSNDFGHSFSKTGFLGRDLTTVPLKLYSKPLGVLYVTKKSDL